MTYFYESLNFCDVIPASMWKKNYKNFEIDEKKCGEYALEIHNRDLREALMYTRHTKKQLYNTPKTVWST